MGWHVFRVAAFAFGIIALTCHKSDEWQKLRSLWSTLVESFAHRFQE